MSKIITSYGILLYFKGIDSSDAPRQYLLAQRRDTVEYTDFIRGKYPISCLEKYVSLMSIPERNRLCNYSFDDLWDDLWVNREAKGYKESKAKAKEKFDKNIDKVLEYINASVSTVLEPSWGFPKGRKNSFETEIECAFREFKEETRLCINHFNLVNMPPIKETFKGSNGKMYSTVYYIAKTDEKLSIKKRLCDGIRTDTISEEIADLKWCDINEAESLLHTHRYLLLKELDGSFT